jgi:hypothetical protein
MAEKTWVTLDDHIAGLIKLGKSLKASDFTYLILIYGETNIRLRYERLLKQLLEEESLPKSWKDSSNN